MELRLISLDNIKEIEIGDDLGERIILSTKEMGFLLADGDIIVIAQKIVSKSENRYKDLESVVAGKQAIAYSHYINKDARLIELILNESKKVIRTRNGLMIVEHNLGFICANAGIDHSNVKGPYGDPENWVLLLPKNPDSSANEIRKKLEAESGKKLGVMIIDSHGRPWRNGVVGVCIGLSGIPGIVDQKGHTDRYGYHLKATEIGAADELAAGASLLMGQADESRPVIIARGFPYELRSGALSEILRAEKDDLFR